MKKRLLITSIVMMLVCAVALSTATYAWFTSNTSVSASIITLKAATSDADALGIGWTGHGAETSIYAPLDATLQPMAPMILTSATTVGALTNGTTTYEYSSAIVDDENSKVVVIPGSETKENHIQFFTSTVKQEGGNIKFNNNGAWQDPVLYNSNGQTMVDDSTTATVNSFYIVNMSKANTIGSVKVSGVFSKVVDDMKYIITTDTTPDLTNKVYYYEDTTGMKKIDSVAGEGVDTDEYTYLSTYGFKSNRTYYECVTQFVLTKDATFQQDTVYYTKNASNGYDLATVTVGDSVTASTYYEKRDASGDNMVRIALFKKEYRYAKDVAAYKNGEGADMTTVSGKTYYRYLEKDGNGTAIMAVDDDITPGQTKFSDVDYDLFCLDNNDHVLLGVLGEEVTTYVKASGKFDRNEVYYTVTFAEDDTVTAANWNQKIIDGIYTQDGDDYVAVAKNTSYTAGTYYKVTASTQQHDATSGSFSTYYTARNTVANGQIIQDQKVNELDYYTGVTADITFANNLKPGEQVDIIAVVWLDGTMLDDTRSNNYAQVSLKFDAQ